MIGHNGRIAWGVTNTGPDVQDLFVERVQGDKVEYKGALEPLTVVRETIKVKGAADKVIDVRITRHGPLISDAIEGTGEPLAFRWTALDADDSTLEAFLNINRARDWSSFTEALRGYKAPMQNFVYADVDGNIGYYAPGALPIRAAGDGAAPAPGWTGEYDWQGYVPFEELPHTYNPPQGYIASANNRVVGEGYLHFIGSSYAAPYRAARIVELIESKPRLSPDDIAAMQADVTSAQAREMLPLLLNAQPQDDRSRQAVDMLRGWDGAMRGDSPQAAIYAAWYRWLPSAIVGDELGDELYADIGGATSDFLAIALPPMLGGEEGEWCDDVSTPEDESCDLQIGKALQSGLDEMARAQGTGDIRAWRWDKVHHAVFPHNPLDNVPQLASIFSRSIPNGGDKFTVDVAPARSVPGRFNQYHVPSYRQIVDLANLDESRFIHTVGQSGSPLSQHYDDLLQRWQRVQYLPMPFSQAAVDAVVRERLTLKP